jgi:hypothetical protein
LGFALIAIPRLRKREPPLPEHHSPAPTRARNSQQRRAKHDCGKRRAPQRLQKNLIPWLLHQATTSQAAENSGPEALYQGTIQAAIENT